MRVLCVDDALPILEDTVAMCRQLPQAAEVTGFTRPREALEWLRTHPIDLALLDIDMPEINGLMLAEQLKRRYPDAAVIFLTAFPQYAVQAFKLRATGYLLKPISLEDLKEEMDYAHSRRQERPSGHIVVQTFGNFGIFVDGETLVFHRSKAKELLAYLIDRSGRGVNRPGIYAALWEEGLYDYSKQKYLDVIIRSLRETLREAGIDTTIHRRISCDTGPPSFSSCSPSPRFPPLRWSLSTRISGSEGGGEAADFSPGKRKRVRRRLPMPSGGRSPSAHMAIRTHVSF